MEVFWGLLVQRFLFDKHYQINLCSSVSVLCQVMPRCGIAVPLPGFGTNWKHLSNGVSAVHHFSVGVWSSLEMRPTDLSLCYSLRPTSTFCTYWRTFSPSPSLAGSSVRLNRRKAMNPLSLANRWLRCCGLVCSLRSPGLMFVVWTGLWW